MHHGRHWSGHAVRGWWSSEKYRGARACWDGATLWSRGGLTITPPALWLAELPAGVPLDGEIWAGRGPAGGAHEVEAAQAVTHSRFTPRLRFLVFDAPAVAGPWIARLAAASRLLRGNGIVQAVVAQRVTSTRHLEQLYAEVARNGGEGLMLRHPTVEGYQPGRHATTLKVKFDPAMVRGVVRVF